MWRRVPPCLCLKNQLKDEARSRAKDGQGKDEAGVLVRTRGSAGVDSCGGRRREERDTRALLSSGGAFSDVLRGVGAAGLIREFGRAAPSAPVEERLEICRGDDEGARLGVSGSELANAELPAARGTGRLTAVTANGGLAANGEVGGAVSPRNGRCAAAHVDSRSEAAERLIPVRHVRGAQALPVLAHGLHRVWRDRHDHVQQAGVREADPVFLRVVLVLALEMIPER
eukprot:scaffold15736_cov114-Isochrysis_galbana.AAC.5